MRLVTSAGFVGTQRLNRVSLTNRADNVRPRAISAVVGTSGTNRGTIAEPSRIASGRQDVTSRQLLGVQFGSVMRDGARSLDARVDAAKPGFSSSIT